MTISTDSITGFLLLNKPAGRTSSACVQEIKSYFRPQKIKIGHAGTLDAFATGLLLIGIGREATKHMKAFEALDKQYIAKAKLGQLTDTLDLTGEVIKEEQPPIDQAQVESVIKNFEKLYEQKPPLYSALKYQGRSLSSLARRSKYTNQELEKIVESKARQIIITKLQLISFDYPFFTVLAHVSSGTYIRSLMHDIAQRLGTVATTYELKRTHVGPFAIEKAIDLHAIDSVNDIEKSLMNTNDCLKIIQEYKSKN